MALLELRWNTRRRDTAKPGRRFLDFVIDGESFFARVRDNDRIAPLGWFPGREDERAARRLLGDAPPDIEDRVALLACAECGDTGCGAMTARIVRDGDEIVWRDFAFSYLDGESGSWIHEDDRFAGWSEIRFDAGSYRAAIDHRPHRTDETRPH